MARQPRARGVSPPPAPPQRINAWAWSTLPNRRQRAFLTAYVTTFGNITRAARAAGLERTAHNWWLSHDPAYAAAFEIARDEAADRMEAECARRAFEGTMRPVYQGGKLVGYVPEYSDRLAELLLSGLRPEKYRRQIQHAGTVEHRYAVNLAVLSEEELARLKEIRAKLDQARPPQPSARVVKPTKIETSTSRRPAAQLTGSPR